MKHLIFILCTILVGLIYILSAIGVLWVEYNLFMFTSVGLFTFTYMVVTIVPIIFKYVP